jgi:cobaltochelatase CobN
MTCLFLIFLFVSNLSVDAAADLQTGNTRQYPSRSAYAVGQQLATTLLGNCQSQGGYPDKICALVWGEDASGREGPMISFVLSMLGVRPRWDNQGSVTGLELIPQAELRRPRIDVTVVTTGQFRDLFRDQVILMDRAFRLALASSYQAIVNSNPGLQPALDAALEDPGGSGELVKGSEPLDQNYVARNWTAAARSFLSGGKSAGEAGELAITRIFAPRENSFGSGVSFDTPGSDQSQLAEQFLGTVCYSYSERAWGDRQPELLKSRLKGSGLLFHCHSDSTDGILDQDGYPLEYTYLLGLASALGIIDGGQSQMYIGDWSGGGQMQSYPGGGYPDSGQGGSTSPGGGRGSAETKTVQRQDKAQDASAKPQLSGARLQHLAVKNSANTGTGGADAAGQQGTRGGRIFEVSAATMSGKSGQNLPDIYTEVVLLALFLLGAGRKYKEYAREAAR